MNICRNLRRSSAGGGRVMPSRKHIREAVARTCPRARRHEPQMVRPVGGTVTKGHRRQPTLPPIGVSLRRATSEGWTENQLRDKLVDVASIPWDGFHIGHRST